MKLGTLSDCFRSSNIPPPSPANYRSQINDKIPPESPDPIFVKTSAESLAHKYTEDMVTKKLTPPYLRGKSTSISTPPHHPSRTHKPSGPLSRQAMLRISHPQRWDLQVRLCFGDGGEHFVLYPKASRSGTLRNRSGPGRQNQIQRKSLGGKA
jgi:hypothetical protein